MIQTVHTAKELAEINIDLKGLNDTAKGVLEVVPTIVVKTNLGEFIEARGLTQAQISQLTGIRQATISDLIHKRRASISVPHMLVLMVALKIPRLSDIFEVTFDDETVKKFEKESKEWVKAKEMPQDRKDLVLKNVASKL